MDASKINAKLTIEDLDKLDLDSISDMPWALKLWEEIHSHTKTSFLNWCTTVKNIAGSQESVIRNWCESYKDILDEVLLDMVVDVLKRQNTTIDKIQSNLDQLQQICKELHVRMPDTTGDNQLCLYDEQQLLQKHITEYEIIRQARREEVDTLNENQERLCRHLGRDYKTPLNYPPLPSQAQLDEFKKYLAELEQERFEREEQYYLLREDIVKNVQELKYKPMNEFERKVLSEEHMYVTQENLFQLDMFSKNIKDMKKSMIEDCDFLRRRAEDLWNMLEADVMDRVEFRDHYEGYDLETLDALRVEVRRCEEIRKANIKDTVEKLRTKLVDLWDKCHCSEKERRQFRHLNNDCYTEDLLDIHDLEIEKWSRYYEKNGALLELLNKHREAWDKIVQLEERANGPDRYKNRGGQLLKEEKERNKLSKLVPSIEKEILELADEYQQNHGTPFQSYGKTAQDYIEQLHAERENAKKVKLSARKMNATAASHLKSPMNLFPSVSRAASPTTPARQRRGAAATPGSSRMFATPTPQKRKVLATPRMGGSVSKRRALTPANSTSARKPLTIPNIKVTHTTLTLPSQKRRSRTSMDKLQKRRRSARLDKSRAVMESDSEESEYYDFENDLTTKQTCRSTIIPDNLLPAATSPKRAKNKKSPGKPPRTPGSVKKSNTKLTACKSNLKLIF